MRASKLREFTINAANTPVLGHSAHRCRIVFFPPFAGTTTWSDSNEITGAGNGILIPAAGVPLALDVEVDGSCVTKAWLASASGYPHSFSILEVFDYPEKEYAHK